MLQYHFNNENEPSVLCVTVIGEFKKEQETNSSTILSNQYESSFQEHPSKDAYYAKSRNREPCKSCHDVTPETVHHKPVALKTEHNKTSQIIQFDSSSVHHFTKYHFTKHTNTHPGIIHHDTLQSSSSPKLYMQNQQQDTSPDVPFAGKDTSSKVLNPKHDDYTLSSLNNHIKLALDLCLSETISSSESLFASTEPLLKPIGIPSSVSIRNPFTLQERTLFTPQRLLYLQFLRKNHKSKLQSQQV